MKEKLSQQKTDRKKSDRQAEFGSKKPHLKKIQVNNLHFLNDRRSPPQSEELVKSKSSLSSGTSSKREQTHTLSEENGFKALYITMFWV